MRVGRSGQADRWSADSFGFDHSFNDPSCEAGKEGESLMLS